MVHAYHVQVSGAPKHFYTKRGICIKLGTNLVTLEVTTSYLTVTHYPKHKYGSRAKP
jgi:hypothetical protein